MSETRTRVDQKPVSTSPASPDTPTLPKPKEHGYLALITGITVSGASKFLSSFSVSSKKEGKIIGETRTGVNQKPVSTSPASPNTPTLPKPKEDGYLALITGITVGGLSKFFSFFLGGKIGWKLTTQKPNPKQKPQGTNNHRGINNLLNRAKNINEPHAVAKPLTFFEAYKLAFQQPHPFSGLFAGVLTCMWKYSVLFTSMAYAKNQLDQINPDSTYNAYFARLGAGAISIYAEAPGSMITALRYDNVSISKILELPFKDYFRGVHAKAGGNALQNTFYFSLLPILSTNQNPILAGIESELIASLFTNSLFTIADNQKKYGTKFFDTAMTLFNDGGCQRFYAGFLTSNLGHMTGKGAAKAFGIMWAPYLYYCLFGTRLNETNETAVEMTPSKRLK